MRAATAIEVLRDRINWLNSKKKDYELCEILAPKIMNLIRLIAPDTVTQWNQKKIFFLDEKRPALEEKAYEEMKILYDSFKEHLEKIGLLDHRLIMQHLFLMNKALEGSPNVLLVHPLWVAYDHFKNLCYEILKLNEYDFLKKYSVIRYSDNLQKMIIDHFFTAITPALFELLELDTTVAWESRDSGRCPGWVAWDTLVCFEWACLERRKSENKSKGEVGWRENRDDVRRGKICLCYEQININENDIVKRCNNSKKCSQSEYLLYLKGLRAEVKAIEDKCQGRSNVSFLKRSNIKKALEIVLSEIYPLFDINQQKVCHIPYAISLDLEDDIRLRLFVEWAPGVVEVCHMHTFWELQKTNFNNVPNSMYQFISVLLENPGVLVNITVDTSGANAKKYLKRMKIDETLTELFIGACQGVGAIFKSKRIVLTHESDKTLKKLRACIDQFQTVRWQ